MPPKKDTAGAEANELLAGFTDKETKLLAAAYLSSTGPDKFDYDFMATLTKNTAGSLKKMWPPVKRKAMESYPSFAKFLGQPTSDVVASNPEAPKPAATSKVKKRKVADDEAEEAANSEGDNSDAGKKASKKPAAEKKGRGRPKKQAKTEEPAAEENYTEDGLDS